MHILLLGVVYPIHREVPINLAVLSIEGDLLIRVTTTHMLHVHVRTCMYVDMCVTILHNCIYALNFSLPQRQKSLSQDLERSQTLRLHKQQVEGLSTKIRAEKAELSRQVERLSQENEDMKKAFKRLLQ